MRSLLYYRSQSLPLFFFSVFNTWIISGWEENNCCDKPSKWQNDNYFHSKWQLWPFWVKSMSFCVFAHLVTTFVFFSAWDKSCVTWNNFQNSTQKDLRKPNADIKPSNLLADGNKVMLWGLEVRIKIRTYPVTKL